MRTRLPGMVAALIAAAALVALAGPAMTRVPGTARQTEPAAFSAVVPDRLPGDPATHTLDSPRISERPPPGAFGEPGVVPLPTRPAGIVVPRPRAGVVVKTPRWRTSGYSWYGPGFYGSGTACGQRYSKTILGVAHKTLPCGTRVVLRNPRNGRTITVPVIDRGPYVAGRSWDLSRATCAYLGNCHTSRIQWRLP